MGCLCKGHGAFLFDKLLFFFVGDLKYKRVDIIMVFLISRVVATFHNPSEMMCGPCVCDSAVLVHIVQELIYKYIRLKKAEWEVRRLAI